MSIALRIVLALAVLAASWFGTNAITEHWRDQGRTEVQAKWDASVLQQERDHAKAIADAVDAERKKEQAAQKAAEQSLRAAAARDAALRSRSADLERGLDGLRRELAATDTAFANYRAARPDAATGAGADDAAAGARELFGQCAAEYAGMAKSAAGLSAQVTGLQEHVIVIQPEAARLQEPVR